MRSGAFGPVSPGAQRFGIDFHRAERVTGPVECPRPWVERVGPPVVRLGPLLTAVGEGLRISAAGRRPSPATFGVLEEKRGTRNGRL